MNAILGGLFSFFPLHFLYFFYSRIVCSFSCFLLLEFLDLSFASSDFYKPNFVSVTFKFPTGKVWF